MLLHYGPVRLPFAGTAIIIAALAAQGGCAPRGQGAQGEENAPGAPAPDAAAGGSALPPARDGARLEPREGGTPAAIADAAGAVDARPSDAAPAVPSCGTGSPSAPSSDGIRVVHHDGQTFVTWPDQAEGEAGKAFRYNVYRSEQPITAQNIATADLWAKGIYNNSAQLFGTAFFQKDRIDSTKPTTIIAEGGMPLPMWSGLAVHTATRSACAYYAVVPTTLDGKPVGPVVPGKNATTSPIAEVMAPLKPLKLYDSANRGPYSAQTKITGTAGLPLVLQLHASDAQGGGAGDYGDYFVYYGAGAMGYMDGLPSVYSVEETHTGPQVLTLRPRDTIVNPTADGAVETYWFGYATIPIWSPSSPLRAYPFTENRLLWILGEVLARYRVDTERVYCQGGSMGAWGTMAFGIRHPEIFAAIFPDRPRTSQARVPATLLAAAADPAALLMDDGKTRYVDRMDSVKYAREHQEDLPFVGWAIGRQDGFASWQSQVEMVRALTDSHHGFAFAWDNGGHDSTVINRIRALYPASRFALHQSYPAFGRSSIDNNLGSGAATDGDLQGGINLGFAWTVQTDSATRWSASISNTLATGPMTVDVTPRRCQGFKLKPGDRVSWRTSTGGSGAVTADAGGHATIAQVQIIPGTPTTLTLQR